MFSKIFYIVICATFISLTSGHLELNWEPRNPAFDSQLYLDLLDPSLCREQLMHIVDNDPLLWAQFTDSGLRIPRGIPLSNLQDWGNYRQCLGISQNIEDSTIEGKFCFIDVPLVENEHLHERPYWIDFNPYKLKVNNASIRDIKLYNNTHEEIKTIFGSKELNTNRSAVETQDLSFKLAVCIPKPCTTLQAINDLYEVYEFQYDDRYCRVQNDKPWAPADYVMISIFSLLGLLTLLSTIYDVWYTVRKTEPPSVNALLKSFSIYTNTRQILTVTTKSDMIECLDGIRVISLLWIMVGNTFLLLPHKLNSIDYVNYILSFDSLWVTAGTIAIDTFFMISGLLLVYTGAHQMETGMKLLKSLHLFYLRRIIRMFPILAAAVLLQASMFHWISDGPVWDSVATATEGCRMYWWTTLLYVQNYINGVGNQLCLVHTWYLAVDMQMYLLSPLLLFWVYGRSKSIAWIALICTLIAVLTASVIYVFIQEFPSGPLSANNGIAVPRYVQLYYYNTLTRGAAFVMGMLTGYLLHIYREKKVKMSQFAVVPTWIGAFTITTLVVYSHYPTKTANWDNQTVDSLINAFCRPLWTLGLGWMIFACHNGYGGSCLLTRKSVKDYYKRRWLENFACKM